MAAFSLQNSKKLLLISAAAIAALLAWWAWNQFSDTGPGEGFVSGNGRIEATEVDVATKLPGRIEEILVREGDFVQAGQPLARMQIDSLQAQYDEAAAGLQQAQHSVAVAEAQVALRQSDLAAAQALITQREAELDAAKRRLSRSQTLSREGAASVQELDDDRARTRGAEAALAATRAQAAAAQAAVKAAEAQLIGARSAVKAAEATVARVQADLTDSELKSPRDGRVQVRVAQPGEVLGAGGRVLNLLDLSDVYMTFFIPETVAGRVALGSEVRIVLDAAPDIVIPARISFVASQAQFTPKMVETANERQKLMFRVRAQIPPELLRRHLEQVKTGVPGVAWLKVAPQAEWPASLALTESLRQYAADQGR
ncbi:HlyD family secretion protein [Paracandidimonas soli]|uniref:HlyD family secretion protein n=1 Tax=Paracandidimonas soli TaxID=1917182 RepID=A0A4V2VRG9_9BURK|nr:efflux RND transporter periplasmic adaptor subunit [Paracandidimonas soli]TCU98379.1 HlyD family secretion protein [Paracandidimonas soli]